MRWEFLLALALVLTVMVPLAHPSPVGLTPEANPLITYTSTATRSVELTQSVHQTAFHYGVTDTPANVTIPFGLTGVTTYSILLTGQVPGTIYPQVNLTQSGAVVLNSTLYGQVALHPSALAVTARTVGLYTTTGTTPSETNYTVFFNATETVGFSGTATPVWAFNGTAYALNYTVGPFANYGLNNTLVYVPFPNGLVVNYTTVYGKVNGVAVDPLQVAQGGVYVYVPGLAVGGSAKVSIGFTPEPTETPPVGSFSFSKFHVNYNSTFTATAYWFNYRTVGYAGVYLLTLHVSSVIDPTTVKVWLGNTLIKNGSFTFTGSSITVLPLVYTTPPSTNESATVQFALVPGQGLSIAPTRSTTLGTPGGLTVTLAQFLILVMGGTLALSFIAYVGWGSTMTTPEEHGRGERSRTALKARQFVYGMLLLFFGAMSILLLLPP
ncbi:MAG: hypothetical protein KGI98_14835 [Euryarchaeota archaeon]|nr:hypothetical protein [Euryarchaeota archaeon]MDE1879443.1 hypothetical protein [Euryarchaeota archaeon]